MRGGPGQQGSWGLRQRRGSSGSVNASPRLRTQEREGTTVVREVVGATRPPPEEEVNNGGQHDGGQHDGGQHDGGQHDGDHAKGALSLPISRAAVEVDSPGQSATKTLKHLGSSSTMLLHKLEQARQREGLDAWYVNPSMLFDEEEYEALVQEGRYWLDQATQDQQTDLEVLILSMLVCQSVVRGYCVCVCVAEGHLLLRATWGDKQFSLLFSLHPRDYSLHPTSIPPPQEMRKMLHEEEYVPMQSVTAPQKRRSSKKVGEQSIKVGTQSKKEADRAEQVKQVLEAAGDEAV